jgi:RalA-binding protein 1
MWLVYLLTASWPFDQAILENYLQTVVKAPLKDTREACEFFNTDVMNEASAPVTQSGYKAGYLTKRGKNFGGYVLVPLGPARD